MVVAALVTAIPWAFAYADTPAAFALTFIVPELETVAVSVPPPNAEPWYPMAVAVAAPVEPIALATAFTLSAPLLLKFIGIGSTDCHTPTALANAFAEVPTAVACAPTFRVPLFETLAEPLVAEAI